MRASDRDRGRAVALLRARCVEGYLSVETFEYRLGRALGARSLASRTAAPSRTASLGDAVQAAAHPSAVYDVSERQS